MTHIEKVIKYVRENVDNDLPEGWWCNECDIDEIIERI